MARVKRAVNAKKHHKAILEEAKGYYGDRSRTFRAANQAVQHSGVYAFRDRRARKGEMRRLWIQRINAGTRAHGLSYSRFIAGLNAGERQRCLRRDRRSGERRIDEVGRSDRGVRAVTSACASAATPR